MLDIKFIRENKDVVRQAIKNKNENIDLDALLKLDSKRRSALEAMEHVKAEQNKIGSTIPSLSGTGRDEALKKLSKLKTEYQAKLKITRPLEEAFDLLMRRIPNIPLPDVPVGRSEEDNVVMKLVGAKPKFKFTPKNHAELGQQLGVIDKERAAKVSGARFAYLKGELVTLQFSIVQFVLRTLGDEKIISSLIKKNKLKISAKPFLPVLPPYMLKTNVFDAMDRLEPREERYKVGEGSDDLWLQGSAEHVLGSMHMDEIISEEQLPLRYVGYATSFRREAGSYGKDMEGIIRLHQFDKLEMEVLSTPETGLDEHKLLCAIQEYLMGQLKLPYRVMKKCTADIGKPNARGIDIDVWLPGQNKYRETHTADYMTDYQARRLKTRVRRKTGENALVHTNDATAFALGRILVAIMENFQQKDGSIKIPKALVPYCGFDLIQS